MTGDVFPIVLVVDDDRIQVALLTSFLTKAGFRVVSALSGVDALEALKNVGGNARKAISLLVSDLDMPGMDGRAFAREMCRQNPSLKVLYVTANADKLFRSGRLLEAHEAFLEKPVTQELLREAVNLLLLR